jgi:hypothetical protein
LGIAAAPRVSSADDITVSGNGSNSNNTVNVSSSQQTTTQQTNNSQISNTVNANPNTGNNSVSNNTGNSNAVKTGDATTSTVINNNANASSVTTGCGCDQDSTATVTGNGAESANTVNVSSTSDTNVSVNQTANITNTISQNAVTGHNQVSNNNGNVSMKTGDITAQIFVKSGQVNSANVSVSTNVSGLFDIKISGNGAGSVNAINTYENNITDIAVNNSANIINNLKEKYITGENSANGNNGSVNIITGNVQSEINLVNGPINSSSVTVSCSCQKEHTKPSSSPSSTPTQPTNNNIPSSSSSSSPSSTSSGGSSSSGPGSVMGASANNLPVTGSYWFFIAFIGNILMMLLGGYLRLRSGRSPGFVHAI